MQRNRLFFVGILWLAAAPLLAANGVVTNGIDTWTTPGDGSSYLDFGEEPIPAGFFCPRSEPFSGRILWRGEPLAAQPSDALGSADTIVQRLDDAVFDRAGKASTRLQMRALSLASIHPIRTRCGTYDVKASLNGIQPIGEMEIETQDGESGLYLARMTIHVKLVFTPSEVAAENRPIVLERNDVEVVSSSRSVWSSSPPEGSAKGQVGGFVLVDTDGDRVADTYLPGQSNFHPRGGGKEEATASWNQCQNTPEMSCHQASYGCHCVHN